MMNHVYLVTAVYMRLASPVNQYDLRPENFSSLIRDDFDLPKDKFTANMIWICPKNLLAGL